VLKDLKAFKESLERLDRKAHKVLLDRLVLPALVVCKENRV
jgi:hypothetical protein